MTLQRDYRFHDVSIKPQTWAAGALEVAGLSSTGTTAPVAPAPAATRWKSMRDLRKDTLQGIKIGQTQKALLKPAFGLFAQDIFYRCANVL